MSDCAGVLGLGIGDCWRGEWVSGEEVGVVLWLCAFWESDVLVAFHSRLFHSSLYFCPRIFLKCSLQLPSLPSGLFQNTKSMSHCFPQAAAKSWPCGSVKVAEVTGHGTTFFFWKILEKAAGLLNKKKMVNPGKSRTNMLLSKDPRTAISHSSNDQVSPIFKMKQGFDYTTRTGKTCDTEWIEVTPPMWLSYWREFQIFVPLGMYITSLLTWFAWLSARELSLRSRSCCFWLRGSCQIAFHLFPPPIWLLVGGFLGWRNFDNPHPSNTDLHGVGGLILKLKEKCSIGSKITYLRRPWRLPILSR